MMRIRKRKTLALHFVLGITSVISTVFGMPDASTDFSFTIYSGS